MNDVSGWCLRNLWKLGSSMKTQGWWWVLSPVNLRVWAMMRRLFEKYVDICLYQGSLGSHMNTLYPYCISCLLLHFFPCRPFLSSVNHQLSPWQWTNLQPFLRIKNSWKIAYVLEKCPYCDSFLVPYLKNWFGQRALLSGTLLIPKHLCKI